MFTTAVRIEHDLGVPSVSLNTPTGHRSCTPEDCSGLIANPPQGRVPVSGVFPAGATLHLLETRLQAIRRRVGHAARCLDNAGPFPRDPPPNRTCPVKGIRLSSDYSVSFAAGCPVWMLSWQWGQTTRDLRRRLAMIAAHTGLSVWPNLSRSASFQVWCT